MHNRSLIRGILFDYGNTLVRIKDQGDVLKELLADLGHEKDGSNASRGKDAFKEYWHKNYEGFPRGQRWTEEIRAHCARAALSAIGVNGDTDRLAREIARRWPSQERKGLYDDVKPALGILNEMGFRLGVLSQNRMTGNELKNDLETLFISRYFTVVITSEDIGCDKPDLRFFTIGSDLFGLPEEELCYVGNRYHEDVLGARSAGITPVLVERRPRHRSRDCISVPSLLSLPALLKA
ncbi:MAG TPA: HAD family hydrolase [Candidatus Angelobacter sp.]|nr:HAD family hydrolase [Candidatus Angelobacter sp.]